MSGACASDPCEHGGTCEDDGDDFNCTCPDDYMGERCQEGS